jgi:site-specific DNA-methyltransferase (adenine-specific)
LAAWVYEQFTEPGAIVLDPFAGAGWAVLGGEQTGRKVRAIEMSEDYIAIMLQRYADATGQQPTLLEAA